MLCFGSAWAARLQNDGNPFVSNERDRKASKMSKVFIVVLNERVLIASGNTARSHLVLHSAVRPYEGPEVAWFLTQITPYTYSLGTRSFAIAEHRWLCRYRWSTIDASVGLGVVRVRVSASWRRVITARFQRQTLTSLPTSLICGSLHFPFPIQLHRPEHPD